ncbi:uncharacterized protein LOC129893202 [Solanum dulcamara]|uniref:uncharacterized protein LOC129893202 n=1 Tax=Solanum dulcamara TaxID=45834 RepID=UPI002485C993|nr:uncharacterized protein LOC129893202 [Solanum dulcamara]
MNPLEFNGSKLDEDPMEFIDEVYQIMAIMGVPPKEKAEIVVYQLKEEKLTERYWGFKKDRVDGGGFNHQRSDYGSNGKGKGGQQFMGQGSINTPPPKFNKKKGLNLMVPRDSAGTQAFPLSKRCGRTHKEEFLAGSNACFKCGKWSHHAWDCSGSVGGSPQGQVSHGQQAQVGGQRTNHFYVLHGRQEVEKTSNVVISILKDFTFDVYVLLDPGANF